MKIYLILIIAILIAVLFAVIFFNLLRNEQKQRVASEELAKVRKTNIAKLIAYIDKLSLLDNEKTKIKQNILEAKNEEDVSNIISSIISSNNSKMQNSSK